MSIYYFFLPSRIALGYFPKKKNSQIITGFTAVIAELEGIL